MSAPNPFMDLASKELEELMSDDIEITAQQFLELDTDEASGSSRQKAKRKYIERFRENGDNRMWNDYFASNPRFDAVGKKGLSPQQKCTAAIRQLAYGVAADEIDEYVPIGESTAILCLQKFCSSVIEIFGEEYLRRPKETDVQLLLEEHLNVHGFPGMLGSIDCMHWTWRNCPTAWKEGNSPPCYFTVNGTQYTQGYYLADGIYPEWSTLIKTFSYPHTDKLKFFTKCQESARKDVERAFGVLQARWAIIRGPARSWSLDNISDIMHACITLHNMIVEDEGHAISNWAREDHEDDPPSYNHGALPAFEARLERFKNLRIEEAHHVIRGDLVEHLWANRE